MCVCVCTCVCARVCVHVCVCVCYPTGVHTNLSTRSLVLNHGNRDLIMSFEFGDVIGKRAAQ